MKNVKVHSSSDSPNGSWGAGSQDVTALRAEIERLTAENERLRRALENVRDLADRSAGGYAEGVKRYAPFYDLADRALDQQLTPEK